MERWRKSAGFQTGFRLRKAAATSSRGRYLTAGPSEDGLGLDACFFDDAANLVGPRKGPCVNSLDAHLD
jgi:hypothetical protein